MDDVSIPLMGVEEDKIQESEFIQDLYEQTQRKCHRVELYPDDFLHDTIQIADVYWMSVEHPVALTLLANSYEYVALFNGQNGNVVIFSADNVLHCRDYFVKSAEKIGLKIIK